MNLRYCDTFRQVLAEQVLGLRASRWNWRSVPQEVKHLLTEDDLTDFKNDRAKAVAALAADLATKRADVDLLCQKTNVFPSPPTFLIDLMDALDIPDADRDAQTRKLLLDPANVRKLARDHGVGVPFSLVLEQELEQIRTTRGQLTAVRRHDTRPISQQTPGGHSARQALDGTFSGSLSPAAGSACTARA